MGGQEQYTAASLKTAHTLRLAAQSLAPVSRLSLPDIDAVVDQVAGLVPAGNIPALILGGLARLPGRRLPRTVVERDIGLLFRGVAQTLDGAIYTTFFAGPAAIMWGYQQLLRLVGKDAETAFPDGVWQFYLDYALRDDTARHANETHGFDTTLRQYGLRLSPADRLAAWTLAAITCLHQYDHLLANEWRERVATSLLARLTAAQPDAARYAGLYRAWVRQRPYGRGSDATLGEAYPFYRRAKFDQFLAEATAALDEALRQEWQRQLDWAALEELPAYQRQMSILAYLEPGPYGETHIPIPLARACIGVIHAGRYALIPACAPGANRPADPAAVRAQVAALLAEPAGPPTPLTALAAVRRASWPELRPRLSPALVAELNLLRQAPILLNGDPRPRSLPLAQLRQAERGVGDHPLTLFDTGETMVFDQSHIFFDGAWGAALAEILTREALAWARYLSNRPVPTLTGEGPLRLNLPCQAADLELVHQAPRVAAEASAETGVVNLAALLELRRLFKRRNELLGLTVNDLLVLYRPIHAATYRPDPTLLAELDRLSREDAARPAAEAALAALAGPPLNPSLVIPVDASQGRPRDRLYPITLEVPLAELDLLGLHGRTLAALAENSGAGAEFLQLRQTYLAALAGFGAVLARVREIASAGESASITTLKLLAHLPPPLQRLLDEIPGRFDVLNDLLKGREVFSNLGAIAPASSLARFSSAKDDNDKKTLVWGALTDARGILRLSLRDFRPHVGLLAACGRQELADRLAGDYLQTYALGLNRFVDELTTITRAGRET